MKVKYFIFIFLSILFSINLVSSITWNSSELGNNLIVYYTIDESSGINVSDYTNHYNATLNNSPARITGISNNAINMTGSSSNHAIIINSDFQIINVGTNPSSISAWINPEGFSADGYTFIAAMNADNVSASQFVMYAPTTNTIGCGFRGSGTFANYSFNYTSLYNKWTNIICVYNGGVKNSATSYSLYVNGTLYTTGKSMMSVGGTGTNNHFGIDSDKSSGDFKGKMDELGIWRRALNSSEANSIWNNGLGYFPTSGTAGFTASINQIYPAEAYVFNTLNISLIVNATPTNGNLSNLTVNIYDADNNLVNSTINVLTGNVQNTTRFNITNLGLGNYHLFYRVCGVDLSSVTNCSIYSSNYTFTIGASIESQYYQANVLETQNSNFITNISIAGGATLTLAQLSYSNVNYTANVLDLGSGVYSLSRSIDIPLNNQYLQNNSFYWRFVYSDGSLSTQETTPINQTVGTIWFNYCNITVNKSAINFTIKDEISLFNINSSFSADFYYWIGAGTIKKNISYINTSASDYMFKFCYMNNTLNNSLDATIAYSANEYNPRTYYLVNSTIPSNGTYLTLKLINTTSSSKFYLTVQKGVNDMANSYIYLSKEVIGTGAYSLVSIRKTDDEGKFTEYLEADKNYQLYVIRDGFNEGSASFQATCSVSPCEKTIQLDTGSSGIFNYYSNTFASGVSYSHYYNKTLNSVLVSYVDTTGLAQYVRLIVKDLNSTGNIICDNIEYAVTGSLTCNMTTYQGNFKSEIYISRSPEKLINYFTFFIKSIREELDRTGLLIGVFLAIIICLGFAMNDARLGVMGVPISMLVNNYLGLWGVSISIIVGFTILAIFIISRGGDNKI